MSRLTSNRSSTTSRVLYLFTRDLRLEDHAGLTEAARHGEVVPALVLAAQGRKRLARSPKRAAFFCEAVRVLADEIAARRSLLHVRRGPLESTALRLAREYGAQTVVWSWAYDAATVEEQRALQSALEEEGIRAVGVHDAPCVAPDETAASRAAGGTGYRAFAAYYANWCRSTPPSYRRHPSFAAPRVAASESLPLPQEFGSAPEARWENPAQLLERFIESGALQYATMCHVPGVAGTSRLGAHLSFGTISARMVLARALERAN
ncbi:MAG TPA: deoxyribodipyrimidine photo-lyase, partial [Candidatus Acidoferrales bacterium]|nr:deoxyribodipyrimidine photo-lyase [Candidatus Acidoferrales bacterium]